ncbi:MAG: nuclear transport factor 2 family protein [Candidatus Limnocylindrales bacterium]
MSIQATLYALELAIARRDVGSIPGGYKEVLDQGFVEFGSSGRIWTRDAMLEAVSSAPMTGGISIEDFEVAEVRPDVFLALYVTVDVQSRDGARVVSRRSSLWVRHDNAFRMRFHQGTTLPGEPGHAASRDV